jgi:uncharacterized protein (DUF1501 family)
MQETSMNMHRRHFIQQGAALSLLASGSWTQAWAQRAGSVAERVLILVELKGGNDGLNTVVPYADATYQALRPTVRIKPDEVLPLDTVGGNKLGLHPSLALLLPLWEKQQLAIVQGLGYPQPNLSHFRSIEIWDTASKSTEYLEEGWVTRAMHAGLEKSPFTTQGVIVGAGDFGPLAGARAVTLQNTDAFVSQSRLASYHETAGTAALRHVLQVENDVSAAAQGLRSEKVNFKTEFPNHGFGNAAKAAAQIVAGQRGKGGVPVMRLSLGSFDTHQNQLGTHANLLKQLAEGLTALQAALQEIGAWDRTLIATYSEFGRRARQNQSNGTDHGTSAPHFVLGGAVRGGWHGGMSDLQRLDASQNLLFTTDFRSLLAGIAQGWWGVNPQTVVRSPVDALSLIRT